MVALAIGKVTVIVPDGTGQVGCTNATVGAGGITGSVFITATVAADVQPILFLTVTL